jgi:DNA-binding MarR family transcriptional regulator
MSRHYDAHLAPTGLRITQFLTLATLDTAPSATMLELAESLDVEATAIGKMTGTLERDGLVTIRRSPTDGRSRIVQLTAEGRDRLYQAVPLWREAQRQFDALNGSEVINAFRQGFIFPEAEPSTPTKA